MSVLLLYVFSAPVLLSALLRLHHVWFGDGGDLRYFDNPVLTTLHLMPGLVFFVLGPLQFSAKKGRWHRVRGYAFIVSGVVTSIGMGMLVFALPAHGGVLTQVSTVAIGIAVVGCFGLAIRAIRRWDIETHRAMMMRAWGLGLTVASARWIIHGGELFGITLEESFLAASIIGTALTILAVEWWLFRTRNGMGASVRPRAW